jgi:ABC-type lipoprotein export system ATPase subunit
MGTDAIVDVRAVSKTYRNGALAVHALREVSFRVGPRTIVAIMGPSGSGKTTLLNIIAGLDAATSGEVVVAGQNVGALDARAATVFRRRHIGFVFQFFNLLPTMSARDNVALPLLADGLARKEIERRTAEALDEVKVAHRADHRPHQMSGGEQQRVAIARAIVMRPRLLLADEPTGNLDSASGAEILALFRRCVADYGLSLLIVTHSDAVAAASDRVLVIRDGRLRDSGGDAM